MDIITIVTFVRRATVAYLTTHLISMC